MSNEYGTFRPKRGEMIEVSRYGFCQWHPAKFITVDVDDDKIVYVCKVINYNGWSCLYFEYYEGFDYARPLRKEWKEKEK